MKIIDKLSDRLFPKSLKPEDVKDARSQKEPALPRKASIPVFIVGDTEETKTTRAPSPIDDEPVSDTAVDRNLLAQARAEREQAADGALASTMVQALQDDGERELRDSDPSLAGVDVEWDVPVSLPPLTPVSNQPSDEEPGTARHVPLILSRAEAYVLMRTLRHAARYEPALAGYMMRKAKEQGVPENRVEFLLALFRLS